MTSRLLQRTALLGLLALSGCDRAAGPLSPIAADTTGASGSLKVTGPTSQSPANSALVSSLTPTLSAAAATPLYVSVSLQYRFQVLSTSSLVVADSGLVSQTSWTVSAPLTPNSSFTWRARAEYQGAAGPWSSLASFKTGDQPPAYAGPIGDWQSCASLSANPANLSGCVWSKILPTNSVADFEVAKRVAWLLRGQGGSLLLKASGDNIVFWQGMSFSASRVCFLPQGQLYKIVNDAGPGGTNAPTFDDNGLVDPTTCVPAIDPSKP